MIEAYQQDIQQKLASLECLLKQNHSQTSSIAQVSDLNEHGQLQTIGKEALRVSNIVLQEAWQYVQCRPFDSESEYNSSVAAGISVLNRSLQHR